jgi:hypothetical protein
MRSLGAVAPSAPSADDGMIVGKPRAAGAAAAAVFSSSRRFTMNSFETIA